MIRIKPHHFIDLLAAFGRGESVPGPHPYGHALHMVTGRILREPDVLLEIDLGADDICLPCRHNVNGLCDDTIDTSFRPAAPASKRDYNLLIDQRWCERLGLAQGDRLTVRAFCLQLRERMGDLAGIYRENPPERTEQRARDLAAGIAFLLSLGG